MTNLHSSFLILNSAFSTPPRDSKQISRVGIFGYITDDLRVAVGPCGGFVPDLRLPQAEGSRRRQVHQLGIFLSYSSGHLAGDVTTPLPGLYTLRLPDYDGEPKTDQLIIRNYNLALHIGDIVCSREPPENRVEFVESKGEWAVRVTLIAPCADMACQILRDDGVGPRPFSADGRTSFDLKPVDGTGSVWAAAMPIPESGRVRDDKGRLPRPFVRVTVLGGAIDRPILTWLYRKSGTSN